jgi:hypothetical protein
MPIVNKPKNMIISPPMYESHILNAKAIRESVLLSNKASTINVIKKPKTKSKECRKISARKKEIGLFWDIFWLEERLKI